MGQVGCLLVSTPIFALTSGVSGYICQGWRLLVYTYWCLTGHRPSCVWGLTHLSQTHSAHGCGVLPDTLFASLEVEGQLYLWAALFGLSPACGVLVEPRARDSTCISVPDSPQAVAAVWERLVSLCAHRCISARIATFSSRVVPLLRRAAADKETALAWGMAGRRGPGQSRQPLLLQRGSRLAPRSLGSPCPGPAGAGPPAGGAKPGAPPSLWLPQSLAPS